MSNATSIFHPVNEQILADIKEELRLQGHHLTGALEASLRNIITETERNISLSASAAGYIENLEHETPADKINISDAEFQGLKRWVVLRGLASGDDGKSGGEASRVTEAIIRAWKKHGRPTPGSLEYSQTGKRTDAIADVFSKNSARYDGLITDRVESSLDAEFSKTKSGTI